MTGITYQIAGVVAWPLQSGTSADAQTGIVSVAVLASALAASLGLRQTFLKAGRAGWKAFVPGYNFVVAKRVIGYTSVWTFPRLGTLGHQFSRCFGKGKAFGLGLVFLPMVFLPILGYGSAEYRGPVVDAEETRQLVEKHKRDARLGVKLGTAGAAGMLAAVSNSRVASIVWGENRLNDDDGGDADGGN